MLNAEHYYDPTASMAVKQVSRENITYCSTPVYVASGFKSPKNPRDSVSVDEMNLDALKQYINLCAKSHRDPATCVECAGCVYGRRAAELMEQTKVQSVSDEIPESAVVHEERKKSKHVSVANRDRAMREYKAAIDSGDVLKYVMERVHSKNEKAARHAAMVKINNWRRMYGDLIHENPVRTVNPVEVLKPTEVQKTAENSADITDVFTAKLEALRSTIRDIQRQMDELASSKASIEKQISTIMETAGILDVAIA